MYALFPFMHSWESQHINGEYSHKETNAIDCGILGPYNETALMAPFDGTIVYKDRDSAGAGMAFQSDTKVYFADGTYDYMTLWTGHDNKRPPVGAKFKQGEIYSHMGTAGGVQKHCHLEVIRGKFKMATKFTSQNYYKFDNSIKPNDGLYLRKGALFKYSNLKWKVVPDTPTPPTPTPEPSVAEPSNKDTSRSQLYVKVDSLRIRKEPSTSSEILGYAKINSYYNYRSTFNDGTYTWYQLKENNWIADDGSWIDLFGAIIPPFTERKGCFPFVLYASKLRNKK